MAAYTSDPIVDPDELGYTVDVAFASSTEEIVINTTAKTIALKVQGNLTTDGATIKAVYSKLKDAWRTEPTGTLIKFPFPMGPITDEQFEMKNGWNWDKTETSGAASQTTPELIRTGGWAVLNTSGNVTEEWAGIVTLGTLGSTDQVYYQQVNASQASVNFKLTGPVNQAVQILRDDNGTGVGASPDFQRKDYFKIFVREWQKVYAQSEIADIGVSLLLSQAYRFPLTNSTDLKISKTEVQIDANSDGVPDVGVYANVNITYLRDSNGAVYTVLGNYDPGSFAYVIGNVVKATNNRWYKCILGYTSNATQPSANSTNWAAYEGERLIGTTYYPFTVIVDGDTTVAGTGSGGAATVQEIYEAVQYRLRQNIDIDASSGSVTGKTANSLLRFVGDTLVTSLGVYIDSYNASDTNNIQMTTYTGTGASTTVNFPFVASLRVNFGENLQNDQYSKYWVFFTDANGNQYGTTNAIIVQDNDDVDMAGNVNPSWPTKRAFVTHTFDYDNNVQGGRTGGTPADVTVVGLGLSTGQYVSTTTTIARSTANSASLVAALERNYSQGTTYP